MSYFVEKPKSVISYLDQRGKAHLSADDAMEANFEDDLGRAFRELFKTDSAWKDLPMGHTVTYVREFIKQHPDMIRILLGDRPIDTTKREIEEIK